MGLTNVDIGSSNNAHEYSAVRHNLVSELKLSVLIYFGLLSEQEPFKINK